jgi:hypothetical protein
MRRFLNLTTLKHLARKRQKPGDVIVGAGAVLGLWTLLYTLFGFAVNVQHICEVLIGTIAPAFLIIRYAKKPSNDTGSSVLPLVARFALSGVAIGVVGILIAVWWLQGSPTVIAGMVGIVIGALASLPGAVAVLFAANLVRYYGDTHPRR